MAILGVADAAEARRRLQRWRRQEQILSIKVTNRARYLAFQIDPTTGQPYPVIKTILAEFAGGVEAGWSPYVWLTAPNGLLGDRIPADVLPADPYAVLEAMRIEGRGFDA